MLRGKWKIGQEPVVGPDQVRYEPRAAVTLLDQSDQTQGRTTITLVYESLPAEELQRIASLLAPAIYQRTPVVVQWFDRLGVWRTGVAYAAPIRVQRRSALHAQGIEITLFLTHDPASFVGQPPASAPSPTQTPPPPESRFLTNEVIPNALTARVSSGCAFILVLNVGTEGAQAHSGVVAETHEPPGVRFAATPSATAYIAIGNINALLESNAQTAALPSAVAYVAVGDIDALIESDAQTAALPSAIAYIAVGDIDALIESDAQTAALPSAVAYIAIGNINALLESNAQTAALPSAVAYVAVGDIDALIESDAQTAALPSAVVSIEASDVQADFSATEQSDGSFAVSSAVVYVEIEDVSAALQSGAEVGAFAIPSSLATILFGEMEVLFEEE